MSRWKHVVFSAAIYRLTVSTDSSLSVAEIRCLSDHQDQIRSLINVNGQSDRKQSQSVASSSSDIQLPPGSGDKLLTHFQPIPAGSVWPRSYFSTSFNNNKKHCRRIQLQPKHNVKEVYSNPNQVLDWFSYRRSKLHFHKYCIWGVTWAYISDIYMILQGFVVWTKKTDFYCFIPLKTAETDSSIIIPFTIKARDRTSYDGKTLNQSNYFTISQFMF